LRPFLDDSKRHSVEPIHDKTMPVILMTPTDVERWLDCTRRPEPDKDNLGHFLKALRRRRPWRPATETSYLTVRSCFPGEGK
jgi:putative SOS response-associated peptidase YedK